MLNVVFLAVLVNSGKFKEVSKANVHFIPLLKKSFKVAPLYEAFFSIVVP